MNARELRSCLAGPLQRFIELRRLAGTDYDSQARLLGYFDRFLDERGLTEPRLTRELIEAYQQTLGRLRPRTRDNRWSVVRQFCEYLSRTDPQCYVPERQRGTRSENARPRHLYTVTEIQRRLAAAAQLPPANSLRPQTYRTLLGRLSSTGLRIGEAFALNLEDFQEDQQCLYIAQGKFRKARWVPLSPSTHQAFVSTCNVDDRRPEHARRPAVGEPAWPPPPPPDRVPHLPPTACASAGLSIIRTPAREFTIFVMRLPCSGCLPGTATGRM